MHSTAVGDDYQLDVWLPDSYEGSHSATRCCTCWIRRPVWAGRRPVTAHIWEQLLPELIVVGIGKPMETLDEWWPIRARDYSPKALPGEEGSGHSDAFQRALQDEILPFIDTTYRTDV